MAAKDEEFIVYETPLFDFDEITDHCFADIGSKDTDNNNYLDGDYIFSDLLSVELQETENSHVLEFDSFNKIKDEQSQSQEKLINQLQNGKQQQQHLNTTKEFKCPHFECGKIFNSQITLNFHNLSHGVTSKNRFKCDLCTKTFVSVEYLVLHKKQHTDIFCDICNDKFNAKSILNRHMSLCHKKTVVCMYCKYKVYTEKQLLEHINKCHFHKTEAKVENNNVIHKSKETAPKIHNFFGPK